MMFLHPSSVRSPILVFVIDSLADTWDSAQGDGNRHTTTLPKGTRGNARYSRLNRDCRDPVVYFSESPHAIFNIDCNKAAATLQLQ
jgi:hypothetical protein